MDKTQKLRTPTIDQLVNLGRVPKPTYIEQISIAKNGNLVIARANGKKEVIGKIVHPGIVDARITDNGKLLLKLSNGDPLIVGPVRAQDGVDGSGFVWRGRFRDGNIYYGQLDNPVGPVADVVEFEGSTFVCTGRTVAPPPSGGWDLMAQRGQNGAVPAVYFGGGAGGGGNGSGDLSSYAPLNGSEPFTGVIEAPDYELPADYFVPISPPRTIGDKLKYYIDVTDYGAAFDGSVYTVGNEFIGAGKLFPTIQELRVGCIVNRFQVADDKIIRFIVASVSGGLYLEAAGKWAHLTYNVGASPSLTIDSQSSGGFFTATTGVLADGQGTDGKINVSANSNTQIYVSNRFGSSLVVAFSDVQSVDTIDFFGIQRALDAAGQKPYGDCVYMPRGRAMLNRPVSTRGGVDLHGASKYHTQLYVTQTGQGILRGANTIQGFGRVGFRQFTAWGYGDRAAGQESGHKLLASGWFDQIEFEDVYVKEARGFSIEGKGTNGASANRCTVERSCRDGINFSDSYGQIRFTNNDLEMIGDDCLAYHQGEPTNQNIKYTFSITATGNKICKSFGAKFLGARDLVFENNEGRLLTGYLAYIGFDSGNKQGSNTHYNVKIDNNLAENVFNMATFDVNQNIGGGIIMVLPSARTGAAPYALPVPPGQYDSIAGRLVLPDSTYHTLGKDRAIAPASGISASNNTLSQTLGRLVIDESNMSGQPTKFSDYGMGVLWYNEGEADPLMDGLIHDVSTGLPCSVSAFRLLGDFEQAEFANNHINGFLNGYRLASDTGKYFGIRIKGGSITRVRRALQTGFTASRACDIRLDDVDINLDPYMLAVGRTRTSGVWTELADEDWSALSILYAKGVRHYGGTVRNARKLAHTNTQTILTRRNVEQFVGTALDGIGVPDPDNPQIVVDSVISSPTFRQHSAPLNAGTRLMALPLRNFRKANAIKDILADVGDGTNLGQADAQGSVIIGTSTNNTNVTEKAVCAFAVPSDWKVGNPMFIMTRSRTSVLRAVEASVDFTLKRQGDGAMATNKITTSKQNLTGTYANYTFEIDEVGIAAGEEFQLEVISISNDTGGSSAGQFQMSRVWLGYEAL